MRCPGTSGDKIFIYINVSAMTLKRFITSGSETEMQRDDGIAEFPEASFSKFITKIGLSQKSLSNQNLGQ
jgi:hypothetical protein